MVEYVECVECNFVLLSEIDGTPDPKGWESCPDCGGTEFRFTGE